MSEFYSRLIKGENILILIRDIILKISLENNCDILVISKKITNGHLTYLYFLKKINEEYFQTENQNLDYSLIKVKSNLKLFFGDKIIGDLLLSIDEEKIFNINNYRDFLSLITSFTMTNSINYPENDADYKENLLENIKSIVQLSTSLYNYSLKKADNKQLSLIKSILSTSSEILNEIIDNIDMVHIKNGSLKINNLEINLEELICNSINIVNSLKRETNKKVIFDIFCKDGIILKSDPIILKKIFIDILSECFEKCKSSITLKIDENDEIEIDISYDFEKMTDNKIFISDILYSYSKIINCKILVDSYNIKISIYKMGNQKSKSFSEPSDTLKKALSKKVAIIGDYYKYLSPIMLGLNMPPIKLNLDNLKNITMWSKIREEFDYLFLTDEEFKNNEEIIIKFSKENPKIKIIIMDDIKPSEFDNIIFIDKYLTRDSFINLLI